MKEFITIIFGTAPNDAILQVSLMHPSADVPVESFTAIAPKICGQSDYFRSRNAQGYGIHFRVTALDEPLEFGKRGGRDKSRYATCLWAEFDTTKYNLSAADKMAELLNSSIPPSLIVNSGGGLHCYWLLTECVTLDNQEIRDQFRLALRGLASKFAGDMSCAEVSRMLRLPGFVNTKPDRGQLVQTIYQSDAKYDWSMMYALYAERPRTPRRLVQTSGPRSTAWLSKVPLVPGQRNNTLYRLAHRMIDYGYDSQSIRASLTAWAESDASPDRMTRSEIDKTLNSALGSC